MRKIALHWQIIIGLVLGVIWALISSSLGISKFTINWIGPFGTIFINSLKMIAVPLVLFSVIAGITSLKDVNKIGRMGGKTLVAYLITTCLAITVGLVAVNTLKPGSYINKETRIESRISYELWAKSNNVQLKDSIRLSEDPTYSAITNQISENQGLEVSVSGLDMKKKMADAKKAKEQGPLQFIVDLVPSNFFSALSGQGSMLQVITFAIFFGIVLLMIPEEKVSGINRAIDGLNEIFLKMVDVIMKAAPFFVFALLAGKISEISGDDPAKAVEIFKGLGAYSLVTVLGLFIVVFIIYPGIIAVFVKGMSPIQFLKGIRPAQLLAFSSSSSAATLPVTMECVHDNLKVSKGITSFVLPIGATVNMDGTSLYQAVAVIFLAQMHMVDLSLAAQLTIILTATLASIGSAAVPSAGLIMLIIVLDSVGLNPEWIAIIFPVDRILDMCRTTVNVTGDATVSTLIAKSEGELGVQP